MEELKVLYLEDEALLGRIVKDSLESRGCSIDWFLNRKAASSALEHADAYDIAVLDVQLPGDSGFEIGQYLRERYPELPIIYLTARVQAKDVLAGFKAGGNDYIRKPFSMEELLVRMHNLVSLRHNTAPAPPQPNEECYSLGRLVFDYRASTLETPAGKHELSHREAELLRFLLLHRSRDVIERKDILMEIWGDDGFFHSRNLDVYVRKLRTYFRADPEVRLITLRGVGYRLVVN